jgi:hypothetical protein
MSIRDSNADSIFDMMLRILKGGPFRSGRRQRSITEHGRKSI